MMEPLAAEDPRQVGTLRLCGRLGSGGMGQVFLGFTSAGQAVAVKVVHPELAADPVFLARFRSEVAAARRVSGAYTAPVVAAGPDDDPPWMATVLVAGPSLAEAVASAGPLPPEATWRLAAGLAEALAAIHGCGLVHRDLKPSNVLLDADGPRVIDFGIARALDGTALTATGLVAGTPAFMSPEQAVGRPVGPASDVFSLGSVLAFAATGAGPFGGGRPAEVLYRVVHAEPAMQAGPAGLRQLVAGCLAKDPAARPTLSALSVAIAAGSPAPRAGQPGPFWPESIDRLIRLRQNLPRPPVSGLNRRRVMFAAGAGVAAFAAAAVAGWAVSQGSGPSRLASQTSPHILRPSGASSPPGTSPAATSHPATKVWSTALGQGVESSPVVSDGIVYVSPLGDNKLYALRGGNGSTLWSTVVTAGILTFLAAAGNVYLIDSKSVLHVLRAADGTELWSGSPGGGVSQVPVLAGGHIYFVGNSSGSVYALNAANGTALWGAALNGTFLEPPAVAGGAVFAVDDGGYLYALNAVTGKSLWTTSVGQPVTPPMPADGVVYIATVDHVMHALRAASGKKLWTVELSGGGASSFPVVAGGTIYIVSNDGYLNALNSGRAGAVSWRTRIPGMIQVPLVIADGTVYAGSSDHRVYAVSTANGSVLWSTGIGGGAGFPLAAADGMLYMSANDKKLYALSV